MKPGDRVASRLPLYHDNGLITSFIIPAIIGCPIVSMDALEWVSRPTMLLEHIERERANYCWLPTIAFQHIVNNDPGGQSWNLSSLKMIVNCSELCREAAFDAFIRKLRRWASTPASCK